MKTRIFILFACLWTLNSFAFSIRDAGKDLCKVYFPLEKGTSLTYENFNSKGKLQSIDIMEITDVIEEAEKISIKIHTAYKDKKGEETHQSDFTYTCEGGSFKVSMESLMNSEQMEGFKGMEVEVDQSGLIIPSELSVGTTLPDARMTVNISSEGIKFMSMNFEVNDRKVEALESIETPAGTFECYKISANTTVKMGFMNTTVKSIDWIAENIGSVKSEGYDKKGNLSNYRVLSEIKR